MISPQTANSRIRTVTYWGLVCNISLSALKVMVGILVKSMSLAADGIHSLSDCLTDFAVILGVRFSSKEPDNEHPFGHGRIETFSTAFIALVLVLVGGGMIYSASTAIAAQHAAGITDATISSWVIWIALLSVAVKEGLYQWTRRVAIQTHSSAVYANAWHHRSDSFSSVAVIIGAISVKFGYPHGDQLGAIAVGIMIILVGLQIISGCIREFSERSADQQSVEQIQQIIAAEPRIRQWHKLRTRSVGREIFLDVHILVDPELNITQAHAIADSLEQRLHDEMTRPVNVMVHIEPDIPIQRK
jgi:cation diffusion facilitator family transporter